MSHHNHPIEIANPGTYKISPAVKGFFGVCALVGVIAIGAAIKTDPHRAWPNFLLNYFFFLMLGVAGAFFTALQHIANAYWSVTIRRLAEGLMSYLPVAFLLGIVLLAGHHDLYEWSHLEHVASDHLLASKAPYLNKTFFIIRMLVVFAVWIGFGFAMRKNSIAQDQTGDKAFSLKNIRLSAMFLPLFALSMSVVSTDLLMSLEPHWFSTIYGIYCFAGLFFSGLSTLAILMWYGKKQGVFSDTVINENHFHDVGKLMFAFTVFWTYIAFSQMMLQWYANLPEEITYYLRRFNGGWWIYSWALVAAHFVIPFFGLLPREAKRCASYLSKMAMFMLVAQWMDIYYLVMPVFFKDGPVFGWIEVGTFLGFFGIFAITVGRFLEKVTAVPVKDPRIAQCVAHNQ